MIELFIQKTPMDCVVASLSMVLGVPYLEVAEAAKRVDPHALRVGLDPREAVKVGHLLGRALTIRLFGPKPASLCLDDLDELSGVLYVRIGRTRHAVVLFNGSIYNPADGQLYLPEVYLATWKAKAEKLLVV